MSGLKAEDNTKLVSADSGSPFVFSLLHVRLPGEKKEKEKTPRILPVKLANFHL